MGIPEQQVINFEQFLPSAETAGEGGQGKLLEDQPTTLFAIEPPRSMGSSDRRSALRRTRIAANRNHPDTKSSARGT